MGGGGSGGGFNPIQTISDTASNAWNTISNSTPGSIATNIVDPFNYMLHPFDGGQQQQQQGPSQAEIAAAQRRQELMNQQQSAIQDFDKNKDEMLKRALEPKDSATKRALQNRIQGIRSNASSRGLLYSGLRENAEGGAQAEAASQMAANRAGLNRAFMSVRDKMQSIYDRMRMNQYEDAIIDADRVYDMALDESNRDTGLIGSLGPAVGSFAGLAASRGRS